MKLCVPPPVCVKVLGKTHGDSQMSGGEALKKRREELHLGIKEIADKLKIRADYLRALENNSFDKLPVPVYTKGYIRCYAQHLGIDPDPIVEYYIHQTIQNKQSKAVPQPAPRKNHTGYYISFFLLLLCVFAILYFISWHEDEKRSIPENVLNEKTTETNEKFVQQPEIAPQPPGTQEIVTGDTQVDSSAPGAVSSQADADIMSPPSDVAIPGKSRSEHSLHLEATDKVWFSLRFKDGHTSEALMKPGETTTWNFSGFVILRVGNAGGLRLVLDGQDLGILGKSGEVLTVRFPENTAVD